MKFDAIVNQLNLGIILEQPTLLTGGITNEVYKLVTSTGTYVIKIINKNNIDTNPNLLSKIEQSESISQIAYKNNITAIIALKYNDKFIQQINNQYYLIYNWCNGNIKLTKEITLLDLKQVATLLAQLHQIKVISNHIEKYSKINYKKYYDLLIDSKEEWAIFFCNNYNKLSSIYDKVYSSYLKLSNNVSYVHKDLNRKNILWDNNIPYIIDWETSTIGNPSIDFFNSAWFLTADIDEDKFYTFAKTYLSLNKINDVEDSANCSIIEECNWLEYSLKRALGYYKSDIEIGKKSVQPSMTEIMNYYDKIPLMLEILNKLV